MTAGPNLKAAAVCIIAFGESAAYLVNFSWNWLLVAFDLVDEKYRRVLAPFVYMVSWICSITSVLILLTWPLFKNQFFLSVENFIRNKNIQLNSRIVFTFCWFCRLHEDFVSAEPWVFLNHFCGMSSRFRNQVPLWASFYFFQLLVYAFLIFYTKKNNVFW